MPILSGVAQLELGHPLRLGNVFRKNDDGTFQEFGFAWTEEPLLLPKLFLQASANGAQPSNIIDMVKVWVETARKDNKVTEALTLFGSTELNWVILYKILEIVKRDIGTKIHEKGWVTKTDEDRFTQTAQHYRHAKHSERTKKWKPHNKPMMFYEAKTFIRTILSNWLRSKEKGNLS